MMDNSKIADAIVLASAERQAMLPQLSQIPLLEQRARQLKAFIAWGESLLRQPITSDRPGLIEDQPD